MGRPKEAAAIRNRRRELDLTADDVAELSGGTVNQRLLSRLENGHANPKAMRNDKYRALAAALSWTEDEFQAAIEGRPPPAAAPAEPASAAPLPAADRTEATSPAERLRLLRERLGYSFRDVAARTHGTISYGTVRQIEARDDAELEGATLGTYRALAQAYAMPLADLLTYVFDESEPPIPAHFAQLMKREATERVVRTAIVDLRYQVRQIEHRLRYLEEQLDEAPSE